MTGEFDVLIVGGGLMGAAVARDLRDADPDVRIVMADGGPVIGPTPGQHLHDVADPAIWERYNQRVASGIQGFYTGVAPTSDVGSTLDGVEPGMYHLTSLGEDAAAMPAASVAWNAGGMGVHWTAATPTPWGAEVPSFLDDDEWLRDLERAGELLRINRNPYPPTEAGRVVTASIEKLFADVDAPGRNVQPMPMAARRDAAGVLRRTGPNVIFPPIADATSDPHFTLLTGTRVTRLIHEGGEVRGARLEDVRSGEAQVVRATTTVVCADAIRSPQLLFGSGIRPPALGRYLNEHAFLTGRVLADPQRLGFDLAALPTQADGETVVEHYWQPHSGAAQPFQVQIGTQTFTSEDGTRLAYQVGTSMYIPTEVQADNRLEFSDEATDVTGMPRITVHFAWSDRDRELIEQARHVQQAIGDALGSFDPETESALLDPGCSLHFTGTVRMGPADDGTNVCDPHGKVRGFDNLFVAGNGVVPTALVCNSTLAGMTTAVRAARAALTALGRPAKNV
ncbi:GMC oxidoreductase [Saccharopolyspora sp. WRP15-2]|uniref:GMC oxidoreductase n=1 Tax=Saccharopolyspora oryzae TaxID=2997343 RepID=A0ABT4V8X4_9PSEU|nr:GMC oxidoreductase [Saccharopolyspora oryzae]MDA3630409.1 GMC oxidoreductase [Saccharopolyspora oryzae]